MDDTLERFDELAEDVFDEDSLDGFIPASVMSNECCMNITIDISTSSISYLLVLNLDTWQSFCGNRMETLKTFLSVSCFLCFGN